MTGKSLMKGKSFPSEPKGIQYGNIVKQAKVNDVVKLLQLKFGMTCNSAWVANPELSFYTNVI